MRHGKWTAAAGCAAALALAGTAAQAADPGTTLWNITGTFDDGGTLSGHVWIDVYGYIDTWDADGYDLVTTGGSNLPGFEYTPDNSYWDNGAFYIQAQPGYYGSLHLTFLNDLLTPSANNPLVGGSPGPSWECQNSWSCYVPQGGQTRYIAEGHATSLSAPEPAAWALMIAGFGLAGGTLRARRRAAI